MYVLCHGGVKSSLTRRTGRRIFVYVTIAPAPPLGDRALAAILALTVTKTMVFYRFARRFANGLRLGSVCRVRPDHQKLH